MSLSDQFDNHSVLVAVTFISKFDNAGFFGKTDLLANTMYAANWEYSFKKYDRYFLEKLWKLFFSDFDS